jgi:xylulose-5-phosphate/fructose-6-phosphate phosphoketolase
MLSPQTLDAIDAWWRAANYLTVGQIYLRANALLREPLRPEHIKPRLLGHWGTSPGINLVYAHLNVLILERDVDALLMVGPGHGGPAVIANTWLEGGWTETYPALGRDEAGMTQLFRQFSTPGGVPSHVSPPVPGSIHEGGELGYVLSHAFGAAFDNPQLLVVAIVGDGEAETAPLEGSWKGISFLDPERDGAVLPILHLNGYKIANPTVLARKPESELLSLLQGHGYEPVFVTGDEPAQVHQAFHVALFDAHERILALRRGAAPLPRPRWPLIVLRTPKGWTGPREVDGIRVEGTFRAHQVPLARVRENPEHLQMLEAWMRRYRPDELFDAKGQPRQAVLALAPRADHRLSTNPHSNGGRLLQPLDLPDCAESALAVTMPGTSTHESTRQLGLYLREVFRRNPKTFRLFSPDELRSNRLDAVLDTENRTWMESTLAGDDRLSPDGRVMEVLSEHNCEGWLEGYLLTGRHGMFVTYEAFAMTVASMATQHAKWLEMCRALPWREPVASLNVLLTSTCWRNDHNGFSHQGPGFIDTLISKQGSIARVYLPPDANSLLSVADHCLRSRNYVNLIVIDKQPQLQWLDLPAAREHCARGASVWRWASNDNSDSPDIVLAAAGDIPTLETVAAAHLLRKRIPGFRVRVVNVVDLFAVAAPSEHPHGMTEAAFEQTFTRDTEVVFAFHGYPNVIHALVHGRTNAGRFHVRGYREEGTTTTPFDMVVLNGMSRYHLAIEALRRARRMPPEANLVIDECNHVLARHHAYIREHLEDMPEVRDWKWA